MSTSQAQSSKRRPQLRKRRYSSGSDTEVVDLPTQIVNLEQDGGADAALLAGTRRRRMVLEAVKELQRIRQRPQGLSETALAQGPRPKLGGVAVALGSTSATEEGEKDEAWRLNRGGVINLSTLSQNLSSAEQEELFGAKFEGETNRRDEDADMLKYIDEELSKRRKARRGFTESNVSDVAVDESVGSAVTEKQKIDPLAEVSEMLKPSIQKRKEDMLSQQMLTGIPEVELGIQAKIRNIEATEEAKQRLLVERIRRSEAAARASGADFVPTNVAACFVQHERLKMNTADQAPSAAQAHARFSVEINQRHQLERERASDDAVVRQFKCRQAAHNRAGPAVRKHAN